jgi:Carboxypeptidase regulatory-like domain/TonB-dependent Receptor Plug Domain
MRNTTHQISFLILIMITLLCSPVMAQVTTGSILGSVHDATGAVVPGATVTITDTGKGTVTRVQTDSEGSYSVGFLIPGTYDVSIEMTGFKRSVSNNIVVDIDQKARVDFALQTGGVTETIEVNTTAPLIRLDSSELGDVVGKTQIQNLPLNGRNFVQLTYLVPGVTAGQAGENIGGSSSFNPRAASNFNSLGSQANSNGYLVDGIIDNEYTFNTVMVQPSVESIAEFKVLTGSFSAEFGSGAGIMAVSTRSGSNALHGEVFLYLRNSVADARNYFSQVGVTAKPAYRRGQYGGAIGGAILKDKLFYFADYYGQSSLKGITNLNSVPTAAVRIGDFSAAPFKIYDPLTAVAGVNSSGVAGVFRQQFMGCDGAHPNVICPNRISQVGLNVASIYPLPQTSAFTNNYTSTANQTIVDNGGNTRIDFHPTERDSAFGRFSYERFVQSSPNPLTGGQGTCCLPSDPTQAKQFDLGPYVAGLQNITLIAQGLSLNETHLFSHTLFNEFRTGYVRTNPFTTQSDFGHNAATGLGIQGLNISQYTTGIPNFTIGSACGNEYTCLQGGTAFLPANPRQTDIQFEDSLSWTKATHQLKGGFRWVRVYASPFTNTFTRGGLTFNDNYTNSGSVSPTGGNGLASILLGLPNSVTRNFLIKPYYITNNNYTGFIQDDWKVNPRLTLNLGVRYDVFTPDIEKNNQLANFDFTQNVFIFAGVNGVGRTAGVRTRHGNVGPRFGFAYDLNGKGTTVIRGGFGIAYFYSPFSASDELGQNPPFTVSQTITAAAATPLPVQFSPANLCSASNTSSSCQPILSNPFPQGATTIPLATLMNTAALNAASPAPAIVGHSVSNPTPSQQTYTFGVEHQMLGGLFEVAYAGSHTLHLTYAYNPNETEPGPSTTSTASRRLIQPLNNISTWAQLDQINSSNYNSLQTKYNKRYSHGLTALISYTYSKSLDQGGSAASGGGSAGNGQTITNLRAAYGASGFDQKHRFVSSINYELPFGPGRALLNQGFVSHIVGGFEVDAITTYGSGAPFTVTLNTNVSGATNSWPDRIGSGKIDHGNPTRFFDTTAFVAPTTPRYGNSARSVLYGPSTKNWDMGVQRRFKLYESMSLALKFDAFNTFNTPNFSTPNAAIGGSNAGKILSTVNDNRDLQASATFSF